jgi:hypothetical protein
MSGAVARTKRLCLSAREMRSLFLRGVRLWFISDFRSPNPVFMDGNATPRLGAVGR